jgi:signal peptidase I
VAAILAAFLVKTFVAQAFFIPSGSMEPQLHVGDRVVVSRLAYRLHDPRRGDIVVFDEPVPAGEERPADRRFVLVRWADDLLQGVGLRQPDGTELIKRVVGLPGDVVEGRGGRVYVNGRELVEPYLPDGTATSDFGPVHVPDGDLFVLGDNRSNSADSRVIGTIPIDSVVGRALARVWPPGRWAWL